MRFELIKTWRRVPVVGLFCLLVLFFGGVLGVDRWQQQQQLTVLRQKLQVQRQSIKLAQRQARRLDPAQLPFLRRQQALTRLMAQGVKQENGTKFVQGYQGKLAPSTGVETIPLLTIVAGERADAAILRTGELDDTWAELRQVKAVGATPFLPQTILTNPQTLAQLAGPHLFAGTETATFVGVNVADARADHVVR